MLRSQTVNHSLFAAARGGNFEHNAAGDVLRNGRTTAHCRTLKRTKVQGKVPWVTNLNVTRCGKRLLLALVLIKTPGGLEQWKCYLQQ